MLLVGLALASPAAAVDLDLGRLEAAVYSLPNVRALVDVAVEEDSFVVSEFADPVLAFPWKQLDHSRGMNATCRVTARLWEDSSFPQGEAPVWKELVDETVVLDNRRRPGDRATFDREGRIRIPVVLNRARPVRRLKIELVSRVQSPFFTDVKREHRAFYLTMRPAWKSREHHHPALMQVMAMAYNRKRAAYQWKHFLRRVALAARSLKDSRRFTEAEMRKLLSGVNDLAARVVEEDVLEQVAEDFLAESGKAMGKIRDGIDAASQELLGARRLAFGALDAAELTWTQGKEALAEAPSPRTFVTAFRDSGNALDVEGALDRALYHLDRQLEALNRLWYITSDAELALMLSRYEENLRLEDLELVELGKRLEQEMGRDYTSHKWSDLGASPLMNERFPADAPGRKPAGRLLRTVWQSLYYLIRSEHFAIQVMAEAAKRSREGFELNAPKIGLKPAFQGANLPPHLGVTVSVTGATIAPGDVASYPISVRNLDREPRQVVLREVGPLPSGWFSSFSERDFTLAPGESKQLRYAVTAPFYLEGGAQVTSSVRVHFDDEPARYHEPTFVTVAGEPDTVAPTHDVESSLDIQVHQEELDMRPGAVARYTYTVRHDGPTKKLVACELLNRPPEGWVAVLDPERLWLEPGEEAQVNLRVTAPLYLNESMRQEWVVGIGYADEFRNKERIAFTTIATNLTALKAEPHLNADTVRTFFVPPGGAATHQLLLENRGNQDDTFDFFVEVPPDGWYLRLERAYVDLPAESDAVRIPMKVQAPPTANAGDFVEVSVSAVSATHPEIRTTQKVRLAIAGDPHLKLDVEGEPYRVAPGDEVSFTLTAANLSEGPMKLGFRAGDSSAHPEWLLVDADVQPIEAGSIRRIPGRLRIPEDFPRGREVPFEVAAVNELGEAVATAPFSVRTTRRHGVDLVLDSSRTLTSKGLVAVKLQATNTGTVEDSIQLFVSGLKRRYWARLSHTRLGLAPNESKEFTLFVRIPPHATTDQDAVVEVQAKSATDSAARDHVSVTVLPNGTR